ncbi:hypothetical protein L4174_018900 [Photobacterium sp. CCB-ST2H9]|uniref:hypothetical protein n=1 Tax=Photobacterium sp. CCB-ST2H9 TaxID=2912855 RepID=UPI0020037689|nr:hypothetical protein [Photobacterium sp. CCB-ST2H9]UTM60129.1 hypothetical protein L4174_018900 [Photobacterium sp. CCB-ST2H9]
MDKLEQLSSEARVSYNLMKIIMNVDNNITRKKDGILELYDECHQVVKNTSGVAEVALDLMMEIIELDANFSRPLKHEVLSLYGECLNKAKNRSKVHSVDETL